MSDKPISPQSRRLIEAERARPDAPADAKAIAQAKLAALLGPAAGLGEGGRGGGGTGDGGSGAATGSIAKAIKGSSGLTAVKALAVFAAGGLVGGGVVAAVRSPVEHVVYVERAAPAASPIASTAPVPPAEIDVVRAVPSSVAPSPARVAAPASTPASSSTGRSRDTDLAAERLVIERARSALARGDGQGALVPIAQHERDFARGQLVEEREALAVQALVIAGRVPEATARAARFRKAYPSSLLLPIVDQALR
jgi:hypothetical protein